MNYYVNPQGLMAAFPVPIAVVDRYFKLAKAEHIKVLLFLLRNMAADLTEAQIAEECGVSQFDVKEALLYWADAEVLLPKDAPVTSQKSGTQKTVVSKREKPSRSDIINASRENPKIQYLMSEAQIKFARNLRETEKSTLVWLHLDEGLDISVILLVIQYAIKKGEGSLRFIESVAVDLIKKGINNVADAEEELNRKEIYNQAWLVVMSAFGIERRKPSQKELEHANMWLNEWKFSKEMLTAAYDECIDHKSKFLFSYVSKILGNWHDAGFKTLEEVKKAALDKKGAVKKDNDDYATYDLDLFEKMLNSKD